MEIMTVKDVMALLGIGRDKALQILQNKSCPTLPRQKGQEYLILKEEFLEYLKTSSIRGKW